MRILPSIPIFAKAPQTGWLHWHLVRLGRQWTRVNVCLASLTSLEVGYGLTVLDGNSSEQITGASLPTIANPSSDCMMLAPLEE